MWTLIQPAIVQVLLTLIPALGLLGLALVTRTTLRLQAGKQAAMNVEFSPLAQQGALSSEQKMQLAVAQLTSPSTPLLARMSEATATRIVEAVLPDVSRLSDARELSPPIVELHVPVDLEPPAELKPSELKPTELKPSTRAAKVISGPPRAR